MLLLGCSQPIGVPKLFAQDLFDADNRVVDRLLDAEAPRHLARSTICDASMEFGSEDPADLSKTTRVLTNHARGRLARRTATSRFSRRISKTAQLLSLIWEQRKEKQPIYRRRHSLKSTASASACTASTSRRPRRPLLPGEQQWPEDSGGFRPGWITSVTAH
jgi:hypothetical protein